MKKFWIAIVSAVLAFAPAMMAQDVVTGVKDLGKDVDKGTKKAAKGSEKAADKTGRRHQGCGQGHGSRDQESC